jgi:glycosyltransferase involved in cell wall biosynthesis
VSYVISTKNRADDLNEAIDRVRGFITDDDELIVVDGLSSDDTRGVIERHSDIIDKFVSEPDRTGGHALNKGMMLAEGHYIRPVTDDDIIHPDGMRQAIDVLDRNPVVDMIICGGTKQILDNPPFQVWFPPGVNYGKSTEDVFRYTGSGAGFVIRRNSLPLIGLLPPSLAGDVEYVLQAIDRGATVKFCRINLYHHPIHKDSYIVKYDNEFLEDAYRLVKLYCSPRFYIYFRVHRLFRKIPAWRRLVKLFRRNRRFPQRVLNKGLRTLRLKRTIPGASVTSPAVKKTERWDGGFS